MKEESFEQYMRQEGEDNMVDDKEEVSIGILGQGKQIVIKGNFIGMLDNGILMCERKLGKKFRRYDGWGISRQLIHELCDIGAKKIIFNIKEEHKTAYILETSPESWKLRGIPFFNPKLKEDQLILPESLWDRKIMRKVRIL